MLDDKQPITLLLENAGTNGQRPLSYLVEVASDANFASKVFAKDGVAPGNGGAHVGPHPRQAAEGPHLLLAGPRAGRRQHRPLLGAR